jgi:hypothetical protein
MPDLPTGTVTFLFTDIESSTRLLHEFGPEPYAAALADHRSLIREAFLRHDGVEVDTQGDASFAGFPTARGALRAARELTDALEAGTIRVRVGVHTGTPLGYSAPPLESTRSSEVCARRLNRARARRPRPRCAQSLGKEAFASEFERGRALSLEEAAAHAFRAIELAGPDAST